MTYIENIAQFLENESLGNLGVDLFVGRFPASPNNCIAVLDTGGVEPDTYLEILNPTFQVFIRNESYPNGHEKLRSIREKLHRFANGELVEDGSYFYFIKALSNGGPVGRDENELQLFSINFLAKVRGEK